MTLSYSSGHYPKPPRKKISPRKKRSDIIIVQSPSQDSNPNCTFLSNPRLSQSISVNIIDFHFFYTLVGINSNVIEITPPLTITKEDIDLAVSILDQAFSDLAEQKINMENVKQYAGW